MATTAKHIVLITGATSGIGFELARQFLLRPSHHVLLCGRTLAKATSAAEQLTSTTSSPPSTLEPLHLDVTDDASIDAAVSHVTSTHGRLDILINNAGISGMEIPSLREQLRSCFDTNATGAAVVTSAFTPLLSKATLSPARVINISSGAGSISRRYNRESPMYRAGGWQYRASKAAMNMISACCAAELEPLGVKVVAYDPGFSISGLSEHNKEGGGARAASESVKGIFEVLDGKRDGDGEKLLHKDGFYEW